MPTDIDFAEEVVIRLRREHKLTWRTKGNIFWFFSLLEEVKELGLALLNLHKHTFQEELIQIASICINWIEYRST